MDLTPRILVWGAGAIGGTVGAFMARAGGDVTLVDANADHVRAIRDRGLTITGPIEAFTQPCAVSTPEDLEARWHTVFLCVKAHHTATAVAAIEPHLAPDGVVVSLQNGFNEIVIAERLGRERTMGAFINFGADVTDAGVIHYGGRGAVVVGELDGVMTSRLAAVHRALRLFEPGAEITDNIWGYLWGKMGYGSLLFASALTDRSIVETLDARDVRPVLTALAREVMAVAAAEGVRAMGFNGYDPEAFGPGGDDDAVEASFAAMVGFNRRSAKTHTGVWRDIAVHRRKTEVDAQFEPILALAPRHGIGVPHLRGLVRLMREVEAGRRPQSWANLADLAEAGRED